MRAPDDPHPDTLHEIIKAHVADDEVRHQKPVVCPITTEPVERLARWKKTSQRDASRWTTSGLGEAIKMPRYGHSSDAGDALAQPDRCA
jgi:hypothetical protein